MSELAEHHEKLVIRSEHRSASRSATSTRLIGSFTSTASGVGRAYHAVSENTDNIMKRGQGDASIKTKQLVILGDSGKCEALGLLFSSLQRNTKITVFILQSFSTLLALCKLCGKMIDLVLQAHFVKRLLHHLRIVRAAHSITIVVHTPSTVTRFLARHVSSSRCRLTSSSRGSQTKRYSRRSQTHSFLSHKHLGNIVQLFTTASNKVLAAHVRVIGYGVCPRDCCKPLLTKFLALR